MKDVNAAFLLFIFTIFHYGQCTTTVKKYSGRSQQTTVCKDDGGFSFPANNDMRNCTWITDSPWIANDEKVKEKWCNFHSEGKVVKDSCPVACDNCSCIDDATFTAKFQQKKDPRNCGWLLKNNTTKRADKFCKRKVLFKGVGDGKVRDYCPVSCNNCCGDDADYRIKLPKSTKMKSCKYVAKSVTRIDKYCDKFKSGRQVKTACRRTCDNCKNYSFDSSPSSTPSSSHAPSSTFTPSSKPSITPSDSHVPSSTPSDSHVPSSTPSDSHVPSSTPSDSHVPSSTPSDNPSTSHTPTSPTVG